MSYLERRRSYTNTVTGETSFNITDLLPKKVTLNLSFPDKEHYRTWAAHRVTLDTLFQDVQVTPPQPVLTEENVESTRTRSVPDLLSTISSVIERDWPSDLFHVVMHSSGFDSRLLSATIRSLYQKHGSSWLGNVLFVCTKWEGESFKDIMAFEGWEPRQYIVIDEDASPDDYYAWSITHFSDAWERLGGIGRLPANFFWYPIAILHNAGLVPSPSNIVLWHAQFANEVISYLLRGSALAFNRAWQQHAYHTMRIRPFNCAIERTPWLNTDIIKVASGIIPSASNTDRESIDFRTGLCDAVLPGLGAFDNIHFYGDERHAVSKRLSDQSISDYHASWYGKRWPDVASDGSHNTQFSDWWEHWSSASLCEHLLNRGYDLV